MKMLNPEVARKLFAATTILGLTLSGTSAVWAQQGAGSQKDQLVGSWKLVSYRAQTEGQTNYTEPLGPNPKGYVIVTPEGRYAQIITASGRKPPKNDADRVALFNSMNIYSGRYTVDKDQVAIMVDTSFSEVQQGARQKQVRFFKIEGNKLTLRTPLQVGTRSSAAGVAPSRSVTESVFERENAPN